MIFERPQVNNVVKGAARVKAAEQTDEESGTSHRFRVAGFAALRKKLNISAAEMGKLLGVSAQSVYRWAERHRPALAACSSSVTRCACG